MATDNTTPMGRHFLFNMPKTYSTQDLLKVAKFFARICKKSEIDTPEILLAQHLFLSPDAPFSVDARNTPPLLQAAVPLILSAHESFPVMKLTASAQQQRDQWNKSKAEFTTINEVIDSSTSTTKFLRAIVQRASQNSAANAALQETLTELENVDIDADLDRSWAKDFSNALFNYASHASLSFSALNEAQPPDSLAPSNITLETPADQASQPAASQSLRNAYSQALDKKVLGQPLALRRFDEALLLSSWMPARQGRPELFLLAGPTVTGKSTFVEALRNEWSARGGAHITLDMASMLSQNEGFALIGLRYGYESAAPGRLTSFVHENPDALIILENVNRAHTNVQSLLIPLLSRGLLTDEYGFGSQASSGRPSARDVSFANTTIVLTCTTAEEVFEQAQNLRLYESDPDALIAQIRDNLGDTGVISGRPYASKHSGDSGSPSSSPLEPYLKQICLLPFRPLDLNALEKIALQGIEDVEAALQCRNIAITWERSQQDAAPRQLAARMLALASAPHFSPVIARAMAADKVLRQWLYRCNDLSTITQLSINLDPVDLAVMRPHIPNDVLQREFFRRSERLDFKVDVQNSSRISLGELRTPRVSVQADYGMDGGLSIEIPQLKFLDIYGHDIIKDRLNEVVRLLKDTSPNNTLNLPRGMLLHGQPGTGKTMLAKALAAEAGLPFIASNGPHLLDVDNICVVFRRARQYAPCLVFLDEIDALGVRGRGGRDACINQLLVEIDGFKSVSDGHVFVIAATNFPSNVDSALTRSGRLDLCLEVPLLDRQARGHFLARLQSGINFTPGLPFPMEELLDLSAGMSGADLEKLVREVQLSAIHRGAHDVSSADLFEELNVIKHGARVDNPPLREHLLATAHHEAGHAVASFALNPDIRLEQVTIIPRRNSLGFTAFVNSTMAGRSMDRKEAMDQICVLLAGRVAERKYRLLHGGEQDQGSDAGASSDLAQATQCAWTAITEWGLDTEFGWLSTKRWEESDIPASLRELASQRTQAWLTEARDITETLVESHWEHIVRLADALLKEEMLLGDRLQMLLKGEIA